MSTLRTVDYSEDFLKEFEDLYKIVVLAGYETIEIDGFVLYKTHDNGWALLVYLGNKAIVKVPEFITEIASMAFAGNRFITSVILPSKLQKVNYRAFADCYNIRDVVFPDSITVIEEEAFKNCIQLHQVTFPKNLETIKKKAFCCCSSLHHVAFPKKLRRIETQAFSHGDLREIYIPDSVEIIDKEAFAGNRNLVKLSLPSGIEVAWSAFMACGKTAVIKSNSVEVEIRKKEGSEQCIYTEQSIFACPIFLNKVSQEYIGTADIGRRIKVAMLNS